MKKVLADLIKISHATGKDTDLVQGGGGNTSIKSADGKTMYIKASGTALKDMSDTKGYRVLDIERVLSVLDDTQLKKLDTDAREAEVVNRLMLSCIDKPETNARPSVETPLHAVLDTAVIHLHPVAVGAYVNTRDGEALVGKLFASDKLPPLWVPYVDPGYTLARKVAELVRRYEDTHGAKPNIIFLQKHGLIVSAATAEKAMRIVKRVIKTCSEKLAVIRPVAVKAVCADDIASAQLAIRKAYFATTGRYAIVKHYNDPVINGFMRRRDGSKLLAAAGLTPDELVYANGSPLWLERADAGIVTKKLQRQIDQGQKPAASFVVKDLGLFVTADEKTAPIVREISVCSMAIRVAAAKLSSLVVLSKKQRDFINNWEAESFRRKVTGSSASGTLKDRIAVVSGAGSGIGRSIAVGLARAGAIVALGDIDTNAAEETRSMILDEIPQATVMPVCCNVTDEASVDEAFGQVQRQWGGLDILVNAAGVAPAYPLVDFPVDKFRFALEVNLTGYFLMARAAARVMTQQDMAGAIINISSKSGLDASKNNTPYNATKAGELHMARGWAMELGAYGIRVNCVCPGNVFEGSKIWNPTYIKACAKKYGIKPEEVIPFYVNKTVLQREIKGQDIADSVVFLASDQARTITGQTIVADSGQVMVR
ncbi:MAG: SDR family oxidoreductase [Sedimentisphaerales bacterium]|nr:SDR family oxidoreductase [Sedimentisphaerales bacterium]